MSPPSAAHQQTRAETQAARQSAIDERRQQNALKRRHDALTHLASSEIAILDTLTTTTVVIGLDDGAPTPTLPGGWTNVARPLRTSITDFQGGDPDELAVPYLIDGWPRSSVEPDIAALVGLYKPVDENGQLVRPSAVKLRGGIPHGGHRWLISDLTIASALTRNRRRIRAQGVITFRREARSDLVAPPAKKRTAKAKQPYRVRAGDTLASIARKECGANTARKINSTVSQIKKLNGIRDPRRIRPGQVIKLP